MVNVGFIGTYADIKRLHEEGKVLDLELDMFEDTGDTNIDPLANVIGQVARTKRQLISLECPGRGYGGLSFPFTAPSRTVTAVASGLPNRNLVDFRPSPSCPIPSRYRMRVTVPFSSRGSCPASW